MITKQFKDWILEAVEKKKLLFLARASASEASQSLGEADRQWQNHQSKLPENTKGEKIVQIEGKSYLVTYDCERWQQNDVKEVPLEVWAERKKPV